MPQDTRLTFQIEGLVVDSGDVGLDTLLSQLELFQRALRISNACIVGQPRPTKLHHRVVGLSHESPASVTVEGLPQTAYSPAHVHSVHGYFIDSISKIRTRDTENIDGRMVDIIESMTQGVGSKFSRILIIRGDSGVVIDEEMRHAFNAVAAQETITWGAIRGHVERYNGHASTRKFWLYPKLGGSVECEFPGTLTENAAAAVERNVSVTGRMRYRPSHHVPYRCSVETIEIHEPDDQLPELQVGMFPDMTGRMPATEYLQELRDGWE